MSTDVHLQPLYGSTKDGPVSSLLLIDGFKVLLDCGWSEPYNVDLLTPLKEYVDPQFHCLRPFKHAFSSIHLLRPSH